MADATRNAVGKRMAVLFIENKQKICYVADPKTGAQTEVQHTIYRICGHQCGNHSSGIGLTISVSLGLDSPRGSRTCLDASSRCFSSHQCTL